MEVGILLNQREGVGVPNAGEKKTQIQPLAFFKRKRRKDAFTLILTCYSK